MATPKTASGETLQALKGHQFVDPLSHIGEADSPPTLILPRWYRAANHQHHRSYLITQGEFLTNLWYC
jgi:SAM-dependent MidA family methyltransferase